MTAPHFFAPDVAGERIVLDGQEARHAVRVLRVRPGEEITVSDGRGEVVRVKVTRTNVTGTNVTGTNVTGTASTLAGDVTERRTEPPPRPRLHVFPAIPKSGKLDLVVQKLTELGADTIRPFPAARSVVRWDAGKAAEQTRRLRAIALEAAKQSRRAWLPEVLPPATLDVLDLPEPCFVMDEESTTRFRQLFPPEAPEAIGLVVGPEGGLSREEVVALGRRGAIPASLGRLVLRTETAVLVAATVVLVRYERLG